MNKLLYLLAIFIFFFMVEASAADATDLGCAKYKQSTGKTWQCPSISDGVKAKLTDVELETGRYTCEYTYRDTLSFATSCTYLSENYADSLKTTLEQMKGDVGKIIRGGGALAAFSSYDIVNFTQNKIRYDSLAFLKEQYINDERLRDNLHTQIVPQLNKFSTSFNEQNAANVKGYLKDLTKTGVKNPKEALDKSFVELVKPYTPDGGTEREKKTFSRFVTGMVTLDPEITTEYNSDTGVLEIADVWDIVMDETILKYLKKAFGQENNNSHTVDTERQNIGKWLDIFKQKIWGFYYNLQRRLDLGYDIIATQLLFVMMAFFAMGASVRGGARYITNRENGQSSGEVKVNEASIMKTLGILATVFAFYISVPSELKSTVSADENTSLSEYEMHTNNSVAKSFVRYAMNQGADFGTMMADLGTDAFLHFVVNKQGLNNGLKEGNNVIASLMNMVYYFPAMEILYECRAQNGMSDGRIATGGNESYINESYINNETNKKADFYKENNIYEIDNALCATMYAKTSKTLHDISLDIGKLSEMIEADHFIRSNATYALVDNHIKLQKELGWMNIVAVPYTYFMLKNQELFFESSYDFTKIEETSRQYVENLGSRDGAQTFNDTLWIKDPVKTKNMLNKADSAKAISQEYTRLAVYNFLPGFTTIRNELLQRMQSLYSDILRIQGIQNQRAAKSKSGASTKDERKLEKKFRDFLNDMIVKARRYYTDQTEFYTPERIKSMIEKGKDDPIALHKAFVVLSYLIAMSIWKSGFIVVFLSAIAMVIGLKVVMYIISVMVHFFIAPFVVIWAFATSTEGGMGKIKNYLRDTLIYMMYPTMIVMGTFMFIFSYEFFYSIYGFITSVLIEGQENAVSLAIAAAGHAKPDKAELSFLSIYAVRDITEILIDLLSVYVAFMTINKFPELILKMMGVSDSAVIMLPQATEALQSKGGGSVNPLSK